VDFAAIAYSDDKDADEFVFDAGDDAVIPYAIFPDNESRPLAGREEFSFKLFIQPV
jgi:hypothetical protein